MVHLKNTAPDSLELKILEAVLALTGTDIRAKIKAISEQQRALTKQHEELQMEIINLIDICPHEHRHSYRACGVETSMCDYCGHQIHVRDY